MPAATARGEFSRLIKQLSDLLINPAAAVLQAPILAREFLNDPKAITLQKLRNGLAASASVLPAGGGGQNGAQASPVEAGLVFLDLFDRWLVAVDNRPHADKLDTWLSEHLAKLFPELLGEPQPDAVAGQGDAAAGQVVPPPLLLERRRTLHIAFAEAWSRLVDSLCAAVLLPSEGELAQRLSRLLLVAGLLERRSFYQRPLAPEEIFALLARRTPLLPSPPFPDVMPEPQVRLVRRVATSDLFVVRREWRCYVADDIASITNVLDGERSLSKFTRIDETELTESSSAEQDQTTELSSETTDESSFEEQTRNAMQLELRAEGQVEVSGQYGTTKVDASAGFAADFSLEDSTDRATQIAKRAVARAASKIETRTREARIRRTLARTETLQRHSFNNDSGRHVRGVYRWVTRIDRFQIWRYPDRFQLEFQLPEPGRYLRSLMKQLPTLQGEVPKPPDFALPQGGITAENYMTFAATYGAAGLREPPQPTQGAANTLVLELSKEQYEAISGAGKGGFALNAPTLKAEKPVAIVTGYAATKVKVSIRAIPLAGKWSKHDNNTFSEKEGYHTIVAHLGIGDKVELATKVGEIAANFDAVQLARNNNDIVPYSQAALEAIEKEFVLSTPVANTMPVVVAVTGALSATVSILVHCEATEQAMTAWQADIYNIVRGAYDDWLREWRAQEARKRPPPELHEQGTGRHEEMIRMELRRHVITWLLGEEPFLGRLAANLDDAADKKPDISIAHALEYAPTIQFLEQSLEWMNMTWVAYPYYWTGRTRWAELAALKTVDASLGQFLRAGSVRVVVSARPGFAAAVAHWLWCRQPWLGGSMAPIPGHPLFVSVAREIRDQTMPPEDGDPGESWEVAVPTALQWLDDDADLPHNSLGRLGQPPHEPKQPLCPDDQPVPEDGDQAAVDAGDQGDADAAIVG